jgi:hypothetical protein
VIHPLFEKYNDLLFEQLPLYLNINNIEEAQNWLDFHCGFLNGQYKMRLKGFRLPFNTVEAAEHIAKGVGSAKRSKFNGFGAESIKKKKL